MNGNLNNPINISYYQNISSSSSNRTPKNIEKEQNQQSEQDFNLLNGYKYYDEQETPKMNINISKNIPQMDNDNKTKKDNENLSEPKNTNTETKNSTINKLSIKKIEFEQIVPIIQNIVVTANLSCPLNLRQIALQVMNTYYEPKKFTGLVMRIKEPKTTALIFNTGKIVVLGAKTEEDSKKACRKYAKIIKSLGFEVILKNITIQNMVGSCDIKFQIPLIPLSLHMKKYLNDSRIAYEPELFPGLIYHYLSSNSNNDDQIKENESNIVFLIFESGKIVIAGGKSKNQIYDAFNEIYRFLCKFKVKNDSKTKNEDA